MSGIRGACAALLAVLVAVALCACGAPRSGRLTVVDPTALPYGGSPSAGTGTTAGGAGPVGSGPRAFFVDRTSRLRPVPVDVSGLPTPQALRRIFDALVAGPAPAQRDAGLATLFAPGTTLELTRLDGGTASVRVQLTGSPPAADTLPLAAGQVVLTATSVPGVERVALLDAGGPAPASLPGGRLAERPVSEADYRSLLADTVSGAGPSSAAPGLP